MPSASWPSMLASKPNCLPSRMVKSAMTFGKPQIVRPGFQGERLVDEHVLQRMPIATRAASEPGGLTITLVLYS